MKNFYKKSLKLRNLEYISEFIYMKNSRKDINFFNTSEKCSNLSKKI